jgi:hypothetical protein
MIFYGISFITDQTGAVRVAMHSYTLTSSLFPRSP